MTFSYFMFCTSLLVCTSSISIDLSHKLYILFVEGHDVLPIYVPQKIIANCNHFLYNGNIVRNLCCRSEIGKEEFVKRTICLILIFAVACTCLTGVTFANNTARYSVSEEGIAFIKKQEGFTKYRVWDNSQYSIGYGTACSAGAYPNGITVAEADRLLRNALVPLEEKLNNFIVENNLPLGQAQYDCLVSFTYNVGATWLKGCRLSRLLVEGMFTGIDFASAIGVWCHAGKSLSSGLVIRRVREIQLFLHGDYTGENSPNYVYVLFDAAGGSMGTDIYFYPQGSAYGMLQTAEKDGTRFLGWYKGDGTKLTESTIATQNLRVTARWQNPHPASQAFSDLSETAWYYGYVDDLYNHAVIQGYEDGTIRPDGNVTIGEALKMIFLACGYPAQTTTATDPTQWASGYRAFAIAQGILQPDEATNLNAYADRLFIARVAALAMKLTLQPANEEIFKDTDDQHILALYWEGIVEGSFDDNGGRYYKPHSYITRAEMFAIISRIMNSR